MSHSDTFVLPKPKEDSRENAAYTGLPVLKMYHATELRKVPASGFFSTTVFGTYGQVSDALLTVKVLPLALAVTRNAWQ